METVFDGVITLVGLAVVASYGWSIRHHFVSDVMPAGARVIAASSVASLVILLALTWLVSQPLAAQLAGLVIQLASAALFFSAIAASRAARLRFVFDKEHPQSLVEQGPYRYVRHPFYVSYTIFWFGWAVATWSIWAIPCVVLLTWLYVAAARLEERNFEASPLSAAYAGYKARTGFFIPRLG
jgi:protein-S-isoprenylcysteine O-methyltransferase Ste14